nr:MAG TPA: hypothetical protein [Caudoviricetes sp.]
MGDIYLIVSIIKMQSKFRNCELTLHSNAKIELLQRSWLHIFSIVITSPIFGQLYRCFLKLYRNQTGKLRSTYTSAYGGDIHCMGIHFNREHENFTQPYGRPNKALNPYSNPFFHTCHGIQARHIYRSVGQWLLYLEHCER